MNVPRKPVPESFSRLEVVPAEKGAHPHPEAWPPGAETYSNLEFAGGGQTRTQATAEADSRAVYPKSKEDREASSTEPSQPQPRRRRWMVWLLLVGVVAVIGAVLGGTLGTLLPKHHQAQSTVGPSPTASSSPTSTTATMSGTAPVLSIYSYPTAVSWGYPHMEVLALNAEEDPSWTWKNSSSSAPDEWATFGGSLESIGGIAAPITEGIAAVTRGSNNVDIFIAGLDFALYHKYHGADLQWGPGLSDWEYRGGIISSPPVAVSWAEDRLDVFVIGEAPGYELFQQYWNEDGWTDWIGLGGSWSTYTPTAISWGPNRIDVFLINPVNKALYHKFWDGSTWQPADSFNNLGGYCSSRPIAVSRTPGRIDVFVRGGDAGLWGLSFSDTWSDWTQLSYQTPIQGEPEAVSWGSDRIDLFAWGADGSLLHKSYNGTGDAWSPSKGFETIGQGLIGPPKAVCDAVGSVHVFSYLQNREVAHKAWNHTLGAWSPSDGFGDLGVA